MRSFCYLIALALCWAPSFLFIKVAVAEVPPLSLAGFRISLGAVILFILMKSQGVAYPRGWKNWGHFAILGAASCAVPFSLIGFGEQSISSAMAAIFTAITPIFTAFLGHFYLPGERFTWNKFSGVLLGFVGVACIFLPSLFTGMGGNAAGITWVTLASCSYSVGIVYARKKIPHLSSLAVPASQLAMAAVMQCAVIVLAGRPFFGELFLVSWEAIGCMISLGAIGTALAYVLYFKILEYSGPTYLSMVSCLFPAMAVGLGVIFLDEVLDPFSYVGFLLVFAGVAVLTLKPLEAKTATLG